jgi:drug/metabolite transporter (DMT)-like permease
MQNTMFLTLALALFLGTSYQLFNKSQKRLISRILAFISVICLVLGVYLGKDSSAYHWCYLVVILVAINAASSRKHELRDKIKCFISAFI